MPYRIRRVLIRWIGDFVCQEGDPIKEARKLGIDTLHQLMDNGERRFRLLCSDGTSYMGKGLKIGLASSALYDWVMPNLEELNLVGYFDCIRTHEDVKHVKPDPELI